MDVVSACPLRVATIVWQPRAGEWALTVVCKATLRLEPGVAKMTDPQEDPVEDDAYWDDDETRSLHALGDIVPFKARADVLLVGHAFAPRREPVTSLTARLVVGEIDKQIEVFCDRFFSRGGGVVQGAPFTKMQLRYERAAGGSGTSNPVGLRLDAAPDERGAVRIPNLQPPGIVVQSRADRFAPVAFGPIAPTWPERASKLSGSAAGWSLRRLRERPLPSEMDQAYFNAAPRDQQTGSIRRDEKIVLENLHPEHPRLETRMPGFWPAALVTTGPRAGERVTLTSDTLWIDTDREIFTVVWRGVLPLSAADEPGKVLVVLERGGLSEDVDSGSTIDIRTTKREQAPTLPFLESTQPPSSAAPPPVDSVLPFRRAAPPPPPPSSPAAAPAPFAAPDFFPAEPPPRIGPLAGVEPSDLELTQVDPESDRIGPLPPALLAPIAAAPPPPPIEEKADDEALPLAAFPIERCAAIAASIALREAEEADILKANELARSTWAALEKHWNEAIQAETERDETALLKAYDAAYVAQIEAERGPFTVEEYARLLGSAGRKGGGAAVPGLPSEGILRIKRAGLRRMSSDRAFAAGLGRAIAAGSRS